MADALPTLEAAVGQALALGGTGYNILAGDTMLDWPTPQQLEEMVGQKRWLVSLYVVAENDDTYAAATRTAVTEVGSLPFSVVVNGLTSLTFSGLAGPNANVHVVVNDRDAYYGTSASDTLQTIALGVAAAINALPGGLVVASATAGTVTVLSARSLAASVTLSRSGQTTFESTHTAGKVQVSSWAADPLVRLRLRDAVVARVGNSVTHSYALPDGTQMRVLRGGPTPPMNDSDSDVNGLYVAHTMYDVSFGETFTDLLTPVAVTSQSFTLDTLPTLTDAVL